MTLLDATHVPATSLPRAGLPPVGARIPALDGLRGLMTLFVVFSHFACEVPGGVHVLSVGWVAVIVFFVLSGFLVGRLAIARRDAGNFLTVFYLRRICRTVPSYLVCASVVLLLSALLASAPAAAPGDRGWAEASGGPLLPGWSYLLFLQNAFMVSRNSYGLHWLAPTWTLALEEQFYAVVPFLFLLAPRRAWVPLLCGFCALGVGLRAVGVFSGLLGTVPLALMPASADVLCAGLLLAVLLDRGAVDWARWGAVLRAAPVGLLAAAALAQRLDGGEVGPWFAVLQPSIVAAAAAAFILSLVMGSPEALRFGSPALRFFGDISYGIYLTHLAVLGLVHGLILGAEPAGGTPARWLATLAAVPATVGLGWALTRYVERPFTAWGRSLRWR